MPIPQAILDALNAVQADADAVALAAAQAAASSAALQAAQAQAQTDQSAQVTAQSHLAADLASLEALLDQTYVGANPTPAAPAAPARKP